MASGTKFSRREFTALAVGALVLPRALAENGEAGGGSDLQSVSDRMVAADKWRNETLLSYSVERHYCLTLGNSRRCAEMRVRVEYVSPDRKTFEVISKTNSGYLEDRVFRQAMSAEVAAAREDGRGPGTRILPCNYDFQVIGTEQMAGRPNYVIRMTPKRKQRYLADGKIWVDIQDAAVTRMDGEVASNSFWVRSFHMVQSYERVGRYWLLGSIHNNANVRFWGDARLDIENGPYQFRSAQERAGSNHAASK